MGSVVVVESAKPPRLQGTNALFFYNQASELTLVGGIALSAIRDAIILIYEQDNCQTMTYNDIARVSQEYFGVHLAGLGAEVLRHKGVLYHCKVIKMDAQTNYFAGRFRPLLRAFSQESPTRE